jgi:hypothetical protein
MQKPSAVAGPARPSVPLFTGGEPDLAERLDEALTGFGDDRMPDAESVAPSAGAARRRAGPSVSRPRRP